MEKDSTVLDGDEDMNTAKAAAPYCRTVDARRVLEGMAVDPLIGMAELARDPDVKADTRAKIYMELAQYLYEKRKSANSEEAIQMETYEERLRRIRGGDNFVEHSDTPANDDDPDE